MIRGIFSFLFILTTWATADCGQIGTSTRPRLSAKDYIELLSLEKHIEGGYFCSYYRSANQVVILDSRYNTEDKYRPSGTSIYFLLEKQDFSAWHRLKSDEIWHYYDGESPIDIHIIDQNGKLTTHCLGNPSMTENASFQVLINSGNWFAAEVRDKESFGLVGCTVSPGFEYSDFELGDRESLIHQYPHYISIISQLTRIPTKAVKKQN